MKNPNTVTAVASSPQTSQRYVGVGMMLGAALAFALLGGLIKALDPRFRVWDIAFYRLFSNAVIILLFFRPWSQLGRVFLPGWLMARGGYWRHGFLTDGLGTSAVAALHGNGALLYLSCFCRPFLRAPV